MPANRFACFTMIATISCLVAAQEAWSQQGRPERDKQPTTEQSPAEIVGDPAMPDIGFDIDAMPQPISPPRLVFDGFDDIRGVVINDRGTVFLADVLRAHLYYRKIRPSALDGATSELLMDENGHIAGMIMDRDGQIIACQVKDKRLISINTRKGTFEELVSTTEHGAPFNSPNDLVMDMIGGIYFTDPDFRHSAEKANLQGVYYLPPNGAAKMVLDDLHRPNGIALSPDGSTLYVTPASDNVLMAYPIISPGRVGLPRKLADLPGPGDGMATDTDGNIYVTQPKIGKVVILSDAGMTLNSLPADGRPTDADFGGPEHNILFVTTSKRLYAFEMNTKGHVFREPDVPMYMAEPDVRLKLPWAFGVKFEDTLTDKKLERLRRDWNDPGRTDYSYLPGPRDGLCWSDLTAEQRYMAQLLVGAVLEPRGMSMFENIRIVEAEANRNGRRDVGPDQYWLNVYGEPGSNSTWGWSLEGHHVSLNTTYQDGKVASVTPMFMGSQPEVIGGGVYRGTRPLGAEGARARSLLSILDEEQRSKAIVSAEAPSNIETPMGDASWNLDPAGLSASDMSSDQRKRLMEIVRLYVERAQSDYARDYMTNVVAPVADELIFTWKGSTKPDEAHYFRVLGPEFVFEYNDGQSTLDHVHTAWRDRVRDYGAHLVDPIDENEDKDARAQGGEASP